MSKMKVKEPVNAVHKNAILCETIMKETRNQELFTRYSVNPFRKIHIIAGKPNSSHDTEEGQEDSNFRAMIKRAHQEPVKKYLEPMTEAQEIGWITKPLIDRDLSDRRLSVPHISSAITKFMEAAWQMKEQTVNLN